ncbi:SAM-dependent methyltransferase [Rhizobacter sp. OV335]|uniref:class I SAM-dependent methyltransferase n=1 Tax=Rhizobacter sp. OV335 TaxID=1500264 RepID=UPI0009F9C52C|nr:SAM-dependent methyltransferase [Rhizobacter sp. OV335]
MTSSTSDGDKFFKRLADSLDEHTFVKLVLAKYRGPEPDLLRATVRRIQVRDADTLSFVYTHRTRDVTKNMPLADGLQSLRERATELFGHLHLMTRAEDVQLMVSKKGQQTLRVAAVEHEADGAATGHDREKHRFVDLARPFLTDLGVTTPQHQLVPAMARKWKQINKFVEVLDSALKASPLRDAKEVRVLDFGAGKGYLTFAMHEYLHRMRGMNAHVTGVELREDMVRLCNAAAQRNAMAGLTFRHGDVRTHAREPVDVMIALHACDIATDYAIDMGIRAGASIIMCSPCCHKQIRPQLLSPHPLRPILQHGIHLGQEAEMLTDGLRALLLDSQGYDTQVFEFVALEHTSKNKMILAVKRAQPKPADEVLAQIREIKAFYGIREHCLETLLAAA